MKLFNTNAKPEHVFFFICYFSSLIGLFIDLPGHFIEGKVIHVTLNFISIFVLIVSFFTLIKYKNIKTATVLLVYSIAINLLISNFFSLNVINESWEIFFVRDSFYYTIMIVTAGFLTIRKHVYALLFGYISFIITLLLYVNINLLTPNIIIFPIFVLLFAFGTLFFNKSILNNVQEKLLLQQNLTKLLDEKLDTERLLSKDREEYYSKLIEQKNRELTTSAMFLARKVQSNKKVINQIQIFTKEKGISQKDLSKFIKSMDFDSDHTIWGNFNVRFNNVYQDFEKNLISKYPNLSSSQKRLAAFIKLGLSNKEISQVTSNTLNSVEVARSRLRKKMGMSHEENLEKIINSL